MKRIISKIFCNQEERSIKRDFNLHFLRESITDTCLLSSLDQFIVLIWKTDVDSRLSVGSPCIHIIISLSRTCALILMSNFLVSDDSIRHQWTVRIWQWTIFRIIEYRGPGKGLVAL